MDELKDRYTKLLICFIIIVFVSCFGLKFIIKLTSENNKVNNINVENTLE